jgi:uncharacterized protein YkwD
MKVMKYIVLGLLLLVSDLYSQPHYIGRDGIKREVEVLPMKDSYVFDINISKHVSNMMNDLNEDSIVSNLFNLVNNHRVNNNLNKLKLDVDLKPVSDLQMNYMIGVGISSHYQSNEIYKTPSKRASSMGVSFVKFGENLIFGKLNSQKLLLYGEYVSYGIEDVNKLMANYLFNLWKNSKGHNDNMLNPVWEDSYISLNFSGGFVSVVQVFKK